MATSVTIPAATPASVAAPAAASTPVSTPSTPVTPVSTPASPNPSTEALTPEQTTAAMVAAAEAKPSPTPDAKAATVTEPDGTVKPEAVVTEAAKPDVKAETKADEDEFSYNLEENGFVGAKDLAAKIDANEALKAALPADLRNEIMANARLAEVASEYEKTFASPEEAQIVAQTAQDFAAFSETFSMIGKDPAKGTTEFIKKLIAGSYLLDDKGQPLKDANGRIRTDGTARKFLDEVGSRAITMHIIDKVAALKDENVQAALDLVMESVGLRPSTADKTDVDDPALTARKAELDAQEARIKEQTATQQKEATQQFKTALDGELISTYESEVKTLLGAATGLSNLERTAVETQLDAAVKKALKASAAYQERKRQLGQQPMSAERRQQEVALAKQFLRTNLVRIARPILAEAGVSVSKKAEDQAALQAAREAAARSEVSGGSAAKPAAPASTQDLSAQREQVRAQLKAQNGRDPDDSEVTVAMMVAAAEKKGFPARAA